MREQIYDSLWQDALKYKEKKDNALFNDGRDVWIRSSMLSMCARKIVYHALQYPTSELESPSSLVTLGIGTQLHEFVQTTLRNSGWLANEEAEVYLPEYHFNGHRDGDIYLDEENNLQKVLDSNQCVIREPNSIWEFKTINNDGFVSLLFKNKPKEDHVRQVNNYMKVTGYKKAMITYLNKNGTLPRLLSMEEEKNSGLKAFLGNKDSYMISFIVDFDEQLWYDTEEKLKDLNKRIAEGKKINANLLAQYAELGIEIDIEKLHQLKSKEHEVILPPKLETYYECKFCAYKPICRTGKGKKT